MIVAKSLLLSLFVLLAGVARAETPPVAHISIIDGDGQISPTQWRSSSAWIWSQNHLLLQTVVEIPAHIAAALPPAMAGLVRGPSFKGPFKLQDDHRFLILELRGPSELFKLGAQSMRVNVDFDHTNWMRSASCREANVSLNEIDETTPAASAPDAFFISLYCRPARNGTWIEIAASDEVSLSFEPHGQIRFQNSPDGTQFWLSNGPHPRVLADVIVSGGNGEVSARYELAADPAPRRLASDAEPIWLPVDGSSSTSLRAFATRSPILGLQAQVLDAHGSVVTSENGRASTELAVVARGSHAFSWGALDADLEIPLRRLGAGLDAKGAGSHFGYVNAGYEWQPMHGPAWTFGAQASILDVRSPDRHSVASISPSVAAHFGPLYSITVAPLDFVSHFSVARARADLPVTRDRKNRLTLEALLGRTWIQPKDASWNVNGVSLGFVGEF